MQKLIVCFAVVVSILGAIELNAADPKTEKPAATEKKGYKNIAPEEFDKLRQKGTNVVLDVRTKKEYQEGHIPGSILIDFNSPDFDKEIAKLDKSKTYLVHCAAGGRSARACKKMEGMNFQSLYNLEGGMGAWQKQGKPVEK